MGDRDDYRVEEQEREIYEYKRHMEKEAEYKAYEEEEMQKWLESEGVHGQTNN